MIQLYNNQKIDKPKFFGQSLAVVEIHYGLVPLVERGELALVGGREIDPESPQTVRPSRVPPSDKDSAVSGCDESDPD